MRRAASPTKEDVPPKKTALHSPDWPDRVHRIFRDLHIRQVGFVPDAGHARLIRLCEQDASMRACRLTSEQEGIGLLTGAWLGGERGALLMQSSGVGNCINMLSLAATCRIPLFMLVTMRGEWGEFNPWQVPMGQGTEAALRVMQVIVRRADRADDVEETVAASARLAFNASTAVAVLLGQRLLGAKDFKELTKG